MLIFVAAVAVVLVVSFLCSVYESVLLSITRPQIEMLVRKGRRAGALLAGFKDNMDMPIAAILIQMAISRSREYKADAGAAALTHNPEGLASGLEKLGHHTRRIPMRATNQTAHLFIVSPLSGKSLSSIFSTHPPLEERVNRLRDMR